MLLLPKAGVCLTALAACVLCWTVLRCLAVAEALLGSNGDQGYHRYRQCCTFCEVLLALHVPLYSSVQVLMDAGILCLRSYSIYF